MDKKKNSSEGAKKQIKALKKISCKNQSISRKKRKVSEAKSRDKNFMQYLQLAPHSMIVYDRAYNHYLQFAHWTTQQVWFVCRLKKNAVYEVMQETFKQELPDGKAGVLKEEHIHLSYKEEKESKTLCLRKVTYKDEKGREYEFITNNFSISNVEVAHVYKLRLLVESRIDYLTSNIKINYTLFLYTTSDLLLLAHQTDK